MAKRTIDLTDDSPDAWEVNTADIPTSEGNNNNHATAKHYAAQQEARKARGDDPLSPFERMQREKTMLAQHSSKSWEHYTPGPGRKMDLITPTRAVLGVISFDPCSSALAQTVVQATQYISLPQDGLMVPWKDKCLVNPPGGDTYIVRPEMGHISRSYAALWWGKLMGEVSAGRVTEAIFVCFKLDLLSVTQDLHASVPPCLAYPTLVCSKRTAYDYPLDTREGYPVEGTERVPGKAPPAASAITYIGPNVGAFKEHFGHLGIIK